LTERAGKMNKKGPNKNKNAITILHVQQKSAQMGQTDYFIKSKTINFVVIPKKCKRHVK